MREECETFCSRSGIPVRFTCGDVPASLPEDVSLCLYRVAQESLRNIRKHARGNASSRVAERGRRLSPSASRIPGMGSISMRPARRAVWDLSAWRSGSGWWMANSRSGLNPEGNHGGGVCATERESAA